MIWKISITKKTNQKYEEKRTILTSPKSYNRLLFYHSYKPIIGVWIEAWCVFLFELCISIFRDIMYIHMYYIIYLQNYTLHGWICYILHVCTLCIQEIYKCWFLTCLYSRISVADQGRYYTDPDPVLADEFESGSWWYISLIWRKMKLIFFYPLFSRQSKKYFCRIGISVFIFYNF